VVGVLRTYYPYELRVCLQSILPNSVSSYDITSLVSIGFHIICDGGHGSSFAHHVQGWDSSACCQLGTSGTYPFPRDSYAAGSATSALPTPWKATHTGAGVVVETITADNQSEPDVDLSKVTEFERRLDGMSTTRRRNLIINNFRW
jgi:hypothetical protein